MCLQLPTDLAEMAFLCSTFLRFSIYSIQNMQINIYKNIRFAVQLVGNVDRSLLFQRVCILFESKF